MCIRRRIQYSSLHPAALLQSRTYPDEVKLGLQYWGHIMGTTSLAFSSQNKMVFPLSRQLSLCSRTFRHFQATGKEITTMTSFFLADLVSDSSSTTAFDQRLHHKLVSPNNLCFNAVRSLFRESASALDQEIIIITQKSLV